MTADDMYQHGQFVISRHAVVKISKFNGSEHVLVYYSNFRAVTILPFKRPSSFSIVKGVGKMSYSI